MSNITAHSLSTGCTIPRFLPARTSKREAEPALPVVPEPLEATFEIAARRARNCTLFSPEKYLLSNPDVAAAGMDPHEHLVKYGCFEGREIFTQLQATRFVGQVACEAHNGAAQLVAGLRHAGADAVLRDETSDPGEVCDHRIIFAPHEFFHAGRGAKWRVDEILTTSFFLSTEQIQTPWYAVSFPYLLAGKGVIDGHFHSMRLLESSGVPCVHYTPTPALEVVNFDGSFINHPLFAGLPAAAKGKPDVANALEDRALDVCFVGTDSPHREKTLASCVPTLANYRCYLYYRRLQRGPIVGSDRSLVSLAAHVSGHSKITLNLHRDYFGAFEWFRIVQLGMCSGSLVLSERGLPAPGFKSGVHYLECDARHMAEVIDWLLKDPDGMREAEKVRRQASAAIEEQHIANRQAQGLIAFLEANR